jgi:hypothetical protein
VAEPSKATAAPVTPRPGASTTTTGGAATAGTAKTMAMLSAARRAEQDGRDRANSRVAGGAKLLRPDAPALASHTQADLDHIAAELNGRPRQTLGWKTPPEKMNQLLLP